MMDGPYQLRALHETARRAHDLWAEADEDAWPEQERAYRGPRGTFRRLLLAAGQILARSSVSKLGASTRERL